MQVVCRSPHACYTQTTNAEGFEPSTMRTTFYFVDNMYERAFIMILCVPSLSLSRSLLLLLLPLVLLNTRIICSCIYRIHWVKFVYFFLVRIKLLFLFHSTFSVPFVFAIALNLFGLDFVRCMVNVHHIHILFRPRTLCATK